AASRPRRARAAAPAGRGLALNLRVHDVFAVPIHRQPDPPQRSARQAAAREPLPGLAAVGGFPNSAPRPAPVHAALRPPPLEGRGIEHLGVGHGQRQVIRARVFVPGQHVLPCRSAVGRLVDAAVAARPEQRSLRRHPHRVVVVGRYHHPVDVVGVREPHVLPRAAAVGGFPYPVAPGNALPVVAFPRSQPHQVRVALRHRHRAHRHQPVVLELRRERAAPVRRLPQPPVRRGDIEDRRVGLIRREIGDAPRHRRRPDRAEMQAVEGRGHRHRVALCARPSSSQPQGDQRGNGRQQTIALEHGPSPFGEPHPPRAVDYIAAPEARGGRPTAGPGARAAFGGLILSSACLLPKARASRRTRSSLRWVPAAWARSIAPAILASSARLRSRSLRPRWRAIPTSTPASSARPAPLPACSIPTSASSTISAAKPTPPSWSWNSSKAKPSPTACAGVRCRFPSWSRSAPRSPPASSAPTAPASSTATSSPATSCSPSRAPSCSISAWPSPASAPPAWPAICPPCARPRPPRPERCWAPCPT